ncbi:hypothetical protein ABIE78_005556 [Sinorhizobium fredii]
MSRSERGSLRSNCSSGFGPPILHLAQCRRQIARKPFGSLALPFKSSPLFSRQIGRSSRLRAGLGGGAPHRIKVSPGRGQIPAERFLTVISNRLRSVLDCGDFPARREELLLQRGALGAFARSHLMSLVDRSFRGLPRSHHRIRCLLALNAHRFEIGPRGTEFLRQGGTQLTLRSVIPLVLECIVLCGLPRGA